jgi:sugar O-acyltransferase (sialic acid O-acetyltransferase NeuD family)
MKDVMIVGDSGLAHEVYSWASGIFNVVGYSTFNGLTTSECKLPGKVFSDSQVTPEIAGTGSVLFAIGSSRVRKKLFNIYKSKGFNFPALVHPSSIVCRSARLGEGVIIAPNSVISFNVKIGDMSYINFQCGVGHDSVIGDYVQINPGSQIGGRTNIGDSALIGSGSTILQGVKIGSNVTVSSGSVVFGEIKDKSTVMGNPARRMRQLEEIN